MGIAWDKIDIQHPAVGSCPECGEDYCVASPGPILTPDREFERSAFTFPCAQCGTHISIQRKPLSDVWLPAWSSALLELAERDDRVDRMLAA